VTSRIVLVHPEREHETKSRRRAYYAIGDETFLFCYDPAP
jgi:hypothetical protein